jgi:hypothetical protein
MRQMQTFCALQLQLQSCRLVVGVLCVVLRGPAYLQSAWPCFFCVSACLYALSLRVGNSVCSDQGGQTLGRTARTDRNGEDGVHAAWRWHGVAWACVCEPEALL